MKQSLPPHANMTGMIDTVTRRPPSPHPLWKIRHGFNDEGNHKSKTKVRQQQDGCSALCSSSSVHSARHFRPCLPLPFRLKRGSFGIFCFSDWKSEGRRVARRKRSGMERGGRFGSRRERKRSGQTGGQDGAYRGSAERRTAPPPGSSAHVTLKG